MTNTYYDKDIKFINTYDVEIPKNIKSINVVSLFSGVGGMDLGFLGGFEFLNKKYPKNPFNIVFANDIFKQAAEVYEYNFKHQVERKSITDINLDVNLNFDNVDVVLGGFPCQTFSYSGKRGGLSDPRGQLYKQMIRVINHCKPKMFIAENVDGIRNSKKDISGANVDQSALDTILSDFENNGYNVQYHVLNAADYGVPQIRRRVIIMGTRKDLGDVNHQYYPETLFSNNDTYKKKWLTSKDAIEDLWDLIDKTSIPNHTYKDFSKAKFYPGRKMQGNNRILSDKPAPTIRAEHHGNIEGHYNYKGNNENDVMGWRRLSVRECARLQSFPDSFNFITSASSSYKMIGNAVPPVMAWHIARAAFYSLDKMGIFD
ncbi:DNA cytosine methyltransferase [Staphylococcus pettenkoferi]|uniref:DNA cytosine methyltransferase n=1 Tax=Staphylococcus pettenkoferi TaxID=170573 RepID=UPI00227309F2|nr:DNA cytosine methyltransferase [Staphylococcus pettenkoferi]MCY1590540.1 DNA cytosine methyltransferase [Staphylococcus pettenkoferi]